jgi:steroid 5-alpha reductase family enzyme
MPAEPGQEKGIACPLLPKSLLISLALITGIMTVLWLLGTARRDVSIVDPFWGTGFVIVTGIVCWLNMPVDLRGWLVVGLTLAWGLRLSLYLLWRNWGHGEDRRYVAMREHHGQRFGWLSLPMVFLLQGAILWFVSLPVQLTLALKLTKPLGMLDAAGLAVWVIGMFFETVGDWQLARFRADPSRSGRVMDRGLWRYTRHPNYFGDFCVWWGLYLIAAAGGSWWTIGSPLLMAFLLMKVSGVTLLETTITDRRPGYAEYKSRTNAFFPGPTRGR